MTSISYCIVQNKKDNYCYVVGPTSRMNFSIELTSSNQIYQLYYACTTSVYVDLELYNQDVLFV